MYPNKSCSEKTLRDFDSRPVRRVLDMNGKAPFDCSMGVQEVKGCRRRPSGTAVTGPLGSPRSFPACSTLS